MMLKESIHQMARLLSKLWDRVRNLQNLQVLQSMVQSSAAVVEHHLFTIFVMANDAVPMARYSQTTRNYTV